LLLILNDRTFKPPSQAPPVSAKPQPVARPFSSALWARGRYQSAPTVRTALVDLAAQRLTGKGQSSRWL